VLKGSAMGTQTAQLLESTGATVCTPDGRRSERPAVCRATVENRGCVLTHQTYAVTVNTADGISVVAGHFSSPDKTRAACDAASSDSVRCRSIV